MQNKSEQLVKMIRELIEILRYDNEYAYELLKRVTAGKNAIISIDNRKVFLEGQRDENNQYKMTVHSTHDHAEPIFNTSSNTLRKIMSGIITIDYALAKNELFVVAPFPDLLNMHKLALTLLLEGPRNHRLRSLWQEFDEGWNNITFPISMSPFEAQKANYRIFIDKIPTSILLIKI